jgi:hypothetical protein
MIAKIDQCYLFLSTFLRDENQSVLDMTMVCSLKQTMRDVEARGRYLYNDIDIWKLLTKPVITNRRISISW